MHMLSKDLEEAWGDVIKSMEVMEIGCGWPETADGHERPGTAHRGRSLPRVVVNLFTCIKRMKDFEKGMAIMNAGDIANGSFIFTQNGRYVRGVVRPF
jgi:hypothetical protein